MARPVEKNPMKCPECGVWVRVVETRSEPDGSKRRRYECGNLHRFTTRETIVVAAKPTPREKVDVLKQALKEASKLKKEGATK